MSALLSCLPTFLKLSKAGRLSHLKCIYVNTYTSRCHNFQSHVVATLSATGIHNTDQIKKWYQDLLLTTPCRTFASRVNTKSRTSYYDILGVTPKATRVQIKSAYYKLSKAYHPDRNQANPAAARTFSEISEAYSVLSNVKLRKRYDNGIYSPRDLTYGVKDEPLIRKKEKKIRNTRSEVYNEQGERMYDFDEYFRAHYGEALQRQQRERNKKERLKKEFENVQQLNKSNVALMVSLAFISIVVGLLTK